jgi:very-short-patch-repair endonuclease
MKYSEIKRIASDLRKNQTAEEKILWKRIRNRQLKGKRFLRQHVIIYESDQNDHYFFIPDFYCSEEKLIIELDGGIHENQLEKDLRRDDILKSKGYRILRFRNEEIVYIDDIIKKIDSYLK